MRQLLLLLILCLGATVSLSAQSGNIQARVWNDLDGDGKQDGGAENSAGLSNVEVKLLQTNNALVSSAQTNASGVATFIAPAGNYKLEFVRPANHRFTLKDAVNNNDTQDSDADRNTGRTAVFSVAGGTTVNNVDAGLWAPGTVRARVWNDLDGDGKQDGGAESSANLAGVTVKLLESNNAELATTTTNASGIAEFQNVPADRSLKLEFVAPEHHRFTLKDNVSNNNSQDSDADRNNGRTATFQANRGNQVHTDTDAGLWTPGTVKARVWNDLDGDGKQDGGAESSANLAGVTVNLLESNNAFIASAQTDANGIATITDVPADRAVKLEFERPANHRITLKDAINNNNSQDSDADRNNGRTATFQASKGAQVHTNTDAGLWAPGTVKARVWNDLDGDGKQDGGAESSAELSGVTVKLLESNNQLLATTTTDNGGIATFTDVPADRALKLEFVRPADHAFTLKDNSSNNQDSDADRNNGRTATFQADRGSDLQKDTDAGLWAPGTVQARVWNDLDGDGKQDGGAESTAELSGVTVNLLESNNQLLATTTTNSGGIAIFQNVPADRSLKLEFVRPADHAFTLKDNSSNSQDSDADRNNGRTATFQADRGSDLQKDTDAGLWAPGVVKARVWEDLDGDGKQDGGAESSGNANVFGYRVELLESNNSPVMRNGQPVVGFTDCGTGVATLDYVPADRSVKLRFVNFAGGSFTSQNASNDNQDSDANLNNGRTATFSANRGSQTFTNIDAGLQNRGSWDDASVIARTWNDLNGNGRQDNNESNANLEGVKVRLQTPAGVDCYCSETASNGIATLPAIGNNSYRLKFDAPVDHKFTPDNQGNNNNIDSDAKDSAGNPANLGSTNNFSLGSGQTITNIDAGLWAPGTMLARVWNDLNGNGKQDNNENGANIAGVTVSVRESNSGPLFYPGTTTQVTAVTNASGIAEIDYVPADRPFKLKFDILTDHKFAPDNQGNNDNIDSDAKDNVGNPNNLGETSQNYSATQGSQVFTGVDAGMWAPGSVVARVWNDLNGNGRQDNNESSANIAGVTVSVRESNSGPLFYPGTTTQVTAVTNASGIAEIDYVPADRPFKLKFDILTDHKFTPDNQGNNDNIDSDAKDNVGNPNNLGETSQNYNVTRGSQVFTGIDAGMWAPGRVIARVWNDLNGNGRQDNNESGANISGVNVSVRENGSAPLINPNTGQQVTGVTGADGTVLLDYIPADRPFKLKFDVLADHKFTPDNQGNNDNIDSDAKDSAGNPNNLGETGQTYSVDRGSQTFTGIDAGMWAPGQAIARVWEDFNGNGRQDNNEQNGNANVFGVRVNLLEANNSPVMNNGQPVFGITDCGTGEALLDYVPADRPVKLEFVAFNGSTFATQNAGNNDNIDSDAATNNGQTANFSANRGNQTFTSIDAGFTNRGNWSDASILARVWNDVDGNGLQNGSESGDNLEGVKVRLQLTDGTDCFCAETASNGIATLPAIGNESYRLKFDLPADHKFTPDNAGNNDNNDSDAQDAAANLANLGKTPNFSLSPGQTITNIDAGMWAPGQVLARVWNDLDGNGLQNGSEGDDNVANVTVRVREIGGAALINPNTGQPVVAQTNANGVASLNYVPADRAFRLKFDLPIDHKFTPDNSGNNDNNDSDAQDAAVDVNNLGQTPSYSANRGSQTFTAIDAGVWVPGKVVARVWNDLDGNGLQNGSESGSNVADVTVRVRESGGAALINPNTGQPVIAQTNANGMATLDYVPADRAFRLKFDLPIDHKFTPDNSGNNDNNDSDAQDVAANVNNLGQTPIYSANRGSQNFTAIDAGVWAPGSVVARVWNDLDGNGLQNGSESSSNIAGVTVRVRESGGAALINPNTGDPVVAQTNANGIATLDYVPADRPFQLKFDLLEDHKFTPDNAGNNDNNDSDAKDVAANLANLGETPFYSVNRGSQTINQIDAGMWAPGTITVRVWEDLDENGLQNGSEAGANLEKFNVRVLETDGSPLVDPSTQQAVTASTNANGLATLYIPADRPFKVKFDLQAEFEFTQQDVGNNDNKDSDARQTATNPANVGITDAYSVDRGSANLTQIDAGLIFFGPESQGLVAPTELTETLDAEAGEVETTTYTLFPVPANTTLNVAVQSSEEALASYVVIDAIGRVVAQQPVELAQGGNQFKVDVSSLTSGTYYFQLRTSEGVLTKTFTVTNF